jgi:hypothetical protein
MNLWIGLILLGLGVAVWLFGDRRRRLWLLGAGAGALLGAGLLRLLPGLSDNVLGLLVVIGLAVLIGVLGLLGTAFTRIIVLAIGFFIGGGITLSFIDALGISTGLFDWILAVIGGVIAAIVFVRFMPWAFIIFASLIGSTLMVRGVALALLPSLVGPLATVLILALTALGIYYHYRRRMGKVVEEAA